MKLKCLPEDFRVTELTDRPTHGRGSFAIYRLTKQSLGTPEAIDAILRRWNLARQQISYGGLKDRHAVTEQFITIKNGPRSDLSQTSLDLNYPAKPTGRSTRRTSSGIASRWSCVRCRTPRLRLLSRL